MDTYLPTAHSLRYRQAARTLWQEVLEPYLAKEHPRLLQTCCFAVCSSVAYGLADAHSDIDTVLILPEEEWQTNRETWIAWSYRNPLVLAFNAQHNVDIRIGLTTWQTMGAGVLLGQSEDWQDYYEGHHHFVSSLLVLHDPLRQEALLRKAMESRPHGLAEAAAVRLSAELASLAAHQVAMEDRRFRGLYAYSIASRVLPLLFHTARVPLPFHKWQWPLAERLGEGAESTLALLRAQLERQYHEDEPFPDGFLSSNATQSPWRVPPLPTGVRLASETIARALASIQWHLEERGCYQMLRALTRGWYHEALYYLCATRCLLIKGTILTHTGRLALGPDLPKAWEQCKQAVPGLETCLWPETDSNPISKALEGIGLFRAYLRNYDLLPEEYLQRPLWSPPSYELACVLEEP